MIRLAVLLLLTGCASPTAPTCVEAAPAPVPGVTDTATVVISVCRAAVRWY